MMKRFFNSLIYALLYAWVRLHALLPMAALYVLSDIFYVLIYRLVRYRVRVVRSNLSGAFPDLSAEERRPVFQMIFLPKCSKWYIMRFMDRILRSSRWRQGVPTA